MGIKTLKQKEIFHGFQSQSSTVNAKKQIARLWLALRSQVHRASEATEKLNKTQAAGANTAPLEITEAVPIPGVWKKSTPSLGSKYYLIPTVIKENVHHNIRCC